MCDAVVEQVVDLRDELLVELEPLAAQLRVLGGESREETNQSMMTVR